MQSIEYAPIVVFVYNRVDYLMNVLSSLAKNSLATSSNLYIFSDGAKNAEDKIEVDNVRRYVNSVANFGWFHSVTITEAESNKGLATSIISGVTEVINKYGKVIVLEDDSVCTLDFLQFMNDCLSFYEKNSKIWSIGGYSFIKEVPSDYNHSIYLMGRTCSYAWATWQDRWEKVDWNVHSYSSFKINMLKRNRFNIYGNDRATLLDLQMHGWINSWAIRFCYAMFENRMYTILPVSTKIRNIGMDERGTHNKTYLPQFDVKLPKRGIPYVLEDVKLNRGMVKLFKKNFDRTLRRRQELYVDCVIKKKNKLDQYSVKKITFRRYSSQRILIEGTISFNEVEKHFGQSNATIFVEGVNGNLIGIISKGDYKRHIGNIYINKEYFKFSSDTSRGEMITFFNKHITVNIVPIVEAGRLKSVVICKRGC